MINRRRIESKINDINDDTLREIFEGLMKIVRDFERRIEKIEKKLNENMEEMEILKKEFYDLRATLKFEYNIYV